MQINSWLNFLSFQDRILEELDKEDSTHDSVSPDSDSEEDGIRIDQEKAIAEKEKVITALNDFFNAIILKQYLWAIVCMT